MTQLKTIKEAIFFLENNTQIEVEDISKYKYEISDPDFKSKIRTDKELIDYANEQKEALEEDDLK